MEAGKVKPLLGKHPHSNQDVFPSSSNIKQHVRGENIVVAGRDVFMRDLNLPSKLVIEFMLVDEPNAYFTGRNNIVDAIHMRFKLCNNQSPYADRTVVLYGMGGIGKSETARFYAFKYHNDSIIKNVAWIDAETETSLKASFVSLANTLQLQSVQENDNVKQIVSMIYKYFSDNIGTGLFIFDNAPQMNQTENQFGIFDFLPVQLLKRPPFVLITSRDNEWDGILDKNAIQVKELDDADSVAFLIKALKLTEKQQTNEIEMAAVNLLAKALQGYPLGLALSTSNIRNAKWTDIASKIEMYIQRMEVPNGPWTQDTFSAGAANKYKLIMSTVWLASLDNIASLPNNKGTEALKLLNLMAYLPTDEITVQFVSKIFNSVFKASCNEESFDLLEKYSFINVMPNDRWNTNRNRIRTHRLVQHCIRAQLESENDVTLFEICNNIVITETKEVLDLMPVMHEHLKQRKWPGDSIKYSVMFCSLCISFNKKDEGISYITDVQSFLDSSNQTCCEDTSLEILFQLCLGYFFTTSKHLSKAILKNLSISTETKEVILKYKKDYLRHLLEGSLYNVDTDEMNPNYILELSNRVCYKILLHEDPFLKKKFGSDFIVLEYLVTYFNSSNQTNMRTEDANKIFEILWRQSKNSGSLSVAQATKCAVKIHRLLQPKLRAATNFELRSYWSYGGPLYPGLIYYESYEADDRSRAFVDAFFIEEGPQIFGQHLACLSTNIDDVPLIKDNYLYGWIVTLAWESNCSSKFIRDADFMESLLLFSNRLFGSRLGYKWNNDRKTTQEMCVIIWFCLFRHNETVDDCRGRSWSINDVINESILSYEAGGFHNFTPRIDCRFHTYSNVFKTFVEATKYEPESAAGNLAKEIIDHVKEITAIIDELNWG